MRLPPFPLDIGSGGETGSTGTSVQFGKVVPWIREMRIVLKSPVYGTIEIGENDKNGVELKTNVKISKKMHLRADKATISISNLTYKQVIQIITGKFFDVEVYAGYRNTGMPLVFKGGILYVSNTLNQDRTNTINIFCASTMVAKFGQARLNLSFRSGINVYTAVRFVSKLAGIPNTCIDEKFKNATVGLINSVNDTPAAWIDKLADQNGDFVVNSDEIFGAQFSMFDAMRSGRTIKISNDQINLNGGYPKLTTEGLRMTMFCTKPLQCGDTLKIDNSLIDLSGANYTENIGYHLNKNGEYIVYEIDYDLSNRGSNYNVTVLAKSKTLFSDYVEG